MSANTYAYTNTRFTSMKWPAVFENPELVKTSTLPSLCADGLCAWGNCLMGTPPPANFGTVLVSIGNRLGMSDAATADNLSTHARRMGWIAPK